MRKLLITSVAALGMAAVPAMAQDTTGTAAGGASVSTPEGSATEGGTVGAQMREKHAKRSMRDHHSDSAQPAATSNSTSTYGSGTVYTDRDRATGGVNAGASATGTGDQSASTTVDAYGSTDSSGSTGEVYGDTSATSTNPDSGQTPN